MSDAGRDHSGPSPPIAPTASPGSAATRVLADSGEPVPAAAGRAAADLPAGWSRLDESYVTLQRIGRWIRVAVFTVFWALASLVAMVAGAPWGVWMGLSAFGLIILLNAVLAHVWPRLAWKRASYRVGDDGIEIRRGVWWREMTTVPRSRVQHTDVTQGPLERSFGLGTLVLYTAGTEHSRVGLPGLAYEDASEIRDRLAALDDDDAL